MESTGKQEKPGAQLPLIVVHDFQKGSCSAFLTGSPSLLLADQTIAHYRRNHVPSFRLTLWGPCEARTSIPHGTPVGIHSFPWPPLPVHQTSDVARRWWLNWIVGAETDGTSTYVGPPSSTSSHTRHTAHLCHLITQFFGLTARTACRDSLYGSRVVNMQCI